MQVGAQSTRGRSSQSRSRARSPQRQFALRLTTVVYRPRRDAVPTNETPASRCTPAPEEENSDCRAIASDRVLPGRSGRVCRHSGARRVDAITAAATCERASRIECRTRPARDGDVRADQRIGKSELRESARTRHARRSTRDPFTCRSERAHEEPNKARRALGVRRASRDGYMSLLCVILATIRSVPRRLTAPTSNLLRVYGGG